MIQLLQRRASALAILDRAIELTRSESPARLLLCTLPALGLTWLALLLYYLEEVEGARALRLLFAFGFAAGYVVRASVLARHAGHVVDRVLAPLGGEPHHAGLEQVLRVSLPLGAELWMWLWLVVLALRIDPWSVLAVLPLLSLRGALAPSWLAAAEQGPERSTLGALLAVLSAAEGARLRGVLLEGLMLSFTLLLFLNLGALSVALISLSQDLLGLSLSFVRAFVSPQNRFALLALCGLSLAAFEPLRAAVSGVLHAETRSAHEALEVRSLVRRAVRAPRPTIVLALLFALSLGRAQAEDTSPKTASPHKEAIDAANYDSSLPALALDTEDCDELCREARGRDDEVLQKLVSILDTPDFREFPDQRWDLDDVRDDSLRRVLDDFLRWLIGDGKRARRPADVGAATPLHISPSLLWAALLIASLATLVAIALRARGSTAQRRDSALPQKPLERSEPEPHERLPSEARERVRALYLAALSGLSRRGFFDLQRTRTSRQYLRALHTEPERSLLLRLTRTFERARYGHATPSPSELDEAEAITAQLTGPVP